MTHAKKVTRKAPPERHILKGVLHKENGDLFVTDTFRGYWLKDAYEGPEKLTNPETNAKVEGNFPNIENLFDASRNSNYEKFINVNEYIKMADVFVTANKIGKSRQTIMTFTGNKYYFNNLHKDKKSGLKTEYFVSGLPEDYDGEITTDPTYWSESLRLFKALGYEHATVKIIGKLRPLYIYSEDEDLKVVIMPVWRG